MFTTNIDGKHCNDAMLNYYCMVNIASVREGVSAIVLTLVAGGGWLFDRRRHRQEVESLKADNRQKDMNLSKMYVEEFKENIADPLRREVRELRTEVNHLRNAIQRINDCPHSDACPVYSELQKQQNRHSADPQ
jgi:hypothetical protein